MAKTTPAKKTKPATKSGNKAATKAKPTPRAKAKAADNVPEPAAKLPEIVLTLTHDQIAERAYGVWEAHHKAPGRDCDNWYEAEDQLREEQLVG